MTQTTPAAPAAVADPPADNLRRIADLERRVRELEAEVRRLSITDDLTGLHNRRGFFLLAEQEWKVAKRAGVSCAVVLIDLDGRTAVTDAHGREAGDALVRNAGAVIRQVFRDTDVVARLGGDEFAVFALGCTPDAAGVRHRLAEACVAYNALADAPGQLAMTVGMLGCDAAADLAQLVARADGVTDGGPRARKATAAG